MIRRLAFLAAIIAVAGCDANQLADAQLSNVVDTLTLGAVHGAKLQYPEAIDVTVGQAVRTDQTPAFDFLFDIDSTGRHMLLPLRTIPGLGTASTTNPGYIKQTITFDALTSAPTDTYDATDTLTLAVGDVVALKSRIACYLGVPQYAKMHVLSFNDSLKTVSLELLADTNCGYRGLQTGIPTS